MHDLHVHSGLDGRLVDLLQRRWNSTLFAKGGQTESRSCRKVCELVSQGGDRIGVILVDIRSHLPIEQDV